MTRLSNIALEQPAGSHSLAAAAHRERWAAPGTVYRETHEINCR